MKNPSIRLIPDWGIIEISVATPLAKLARSLLIADELAKISLSDNLSGSCGVTSDQLGQKSYVEMQIGKQWKVVPLSRFLKIPLRVILQNRLQGQHPLNPLNSIADTGLFFKQNIIKTPDLLQRKAQAFRYSLF